MANFVRQPSKGSIGSQSPSKTPDTMRRGRGSQTAVFPRVQNYSNINQSPRPRESILEGNSPSRQVTDQKRKEAGSSKEGIIILEEENSRRTQPSKEEASQAVAFFNTRQQQLFSGVPTDFITTKSAVGPSI